jgi:hypothetical protein
VARNPIDRSGFQAVAPNSIGIRHMGGALGFTVTSEAGEIWDGGVRRHPRKTGYRIGSVAADRSVGPATLSIGLSRLDEESTVFGGRVNPLGSGAGANSYFVDVAASARLSRGWGISGTVRRGWTSLPGSGELMSGGRLATDAWSVDFSKTDFVRNGDKIALRVMQPLRVHSGGFNMTLPTSYDYATRSAGFEKRFFNLAPKGREIDVEMAYSLNLRGGYFGFNAFYRNDPGHIEAARADLGAAVRLALGF